MKCEMPGLGVGLVAGARADPEADRHRAHVREPLRDDALARVQLREHVLLLHGRIVLARTAARLAAWSSRSRWRRRSRRCRTTCARRCRTSRSWSRTSRRPGQPLLGLYEGIPLTARTSWYAGAAPDKISIYRGPLERLYGHDPELLERMIRRVVLHEIAHHFGISDERLVELDRY